MKKIILLLLIFITGNCLAGTRLITTYYSTANDSIWFIKIVDGVRIDSAKWTTQNMDTQITIADDVHTKILLKNWFENVDSAHSFTVEWNAAVVAIASGARTMTYYTIDTSASPDDTLAKKTVYIVDQTGSQYLNTQTNTAGYVSVACDDNDTFLVYVRAMPSYNFLGENDIGYDSVFIVNGDTTIDLQVYRLAVSSPSNPDVCRLFAYLRDAGGEVLSGGQLIVTVLGGNIEDTCNGNTPITNRVIYGIISDADSGLTYADVIKSKCLLKQGGVASSVKYKVEIDYGIRVDYKWTDTIPDIDTLRVTRY